MRKLFAIIILIIIIISATPSLSLAGSAPDNYIQNSFESSLFSDYCDYDYKIEVPPGVDKFAPGLSIS